MPSTATAKHGFVQAHKSQIWLVCIPKKHVPDEYRTRDLQIRSLTRYPLRHIDSFTEEGKYAVLTFEFSPTFRPITNVCLTHQSYMQLIDRFDWSICLIDLTGRFV
jgi:hypothetical protein